MTTGFVSFAFAALALPFAGAALAIPALRLAKRTATGFLALLPVLVFAIFSSQAGSIAGGGVRSFGLDWIPALGIRFSFRLDGLSFVFALLVSGIGALVILFSGGYLAGDRRLGRFMSFMFLFMGSMLGLVLADDLVTLAVFWEATAISSFLLIGFDHEREAARRGAVQALAITGGGGLALLAAAVLLREGFGLTSLSAILDAGDALRDAPSYAVILTLVLAAAFTKSAQAPFHVWLPNAMEAPTPVSAYLHSATMVKAGVYLLMRLYPALGGTELWETVLPVFGGVTFLMGALLALRQHDLKLVLAYTTLASLGLLVMLIGIGGEAAIEAAVLYLLAHALFKGGLFMVAGAIAHGAGTRDGRALGGLASAMPLTFAAALLGALSMGGVLPFFGFLAKEAIYGATATGASLRPLLLTSAALAGNAMMFAAAFTVALKPFVGHRPAGLARVHEGGVLLLLGPLMLGIAGLASGVLSGSTHKLLSEPMTAAILGHPVAVAVSAVPHLNTAFTLSLLTIASGLALYVRIDPVRLWLAAALERIGWGPDRGFDQMLGGLVRLSFRVTSIHQSGRLDRYMTATFLAIAAALLVPLASSDRWPGLPAFPHLAIREWIVVLMLCAGLGVVVASRSRLTAIVSLGIQGFAVALIFALAGAPDLSFTQFMVETLSVVILALVMTRLKLDASDRRPLREILFGGSVALACGLGFSTLLLAIAERPLDMTLPEFFGRYSYAVAHGRNVVNVILVDFRGLDTLGEITVVMTAGLAILALIRVRAGTTASAARGRAE